MHGCVVCSVSLQVIIESKHIDLVKSGDRGALVVDFGNVYAIFLSGNSKKMVIFFSKVIFHTLDGSYRSTFGG